jgi:Mlc titration factor MtfA (ptsG expression regulator)
VSWFSSRTKPDLRGTLPPEHWLPILHERFPTVERLTDAQQAQLFGYMQSFLDRIGFEGCGGQDITEEIRVTIAAQACLLLIGREHDVYPRLKTVLVYPHTYVSGKHGLFGGDNGEGARLGESWTTGVVVLAWDSVVGGARNVEDGHNVTFHEFAHQLDQEDGRADGAPILETRAAYATWARVFSADFKSLCDKTEHGKRDVIDRYGATNPAEFFAVATETFFEKPGQLKAVHAELYDALHAYYKINPLEWFQEITPHSALDSPRLTEQNNQPAGKH